MKRLWFAAALILALATLSGWHVIQLRQFTGQLTGLLEGAQGQVEQEHWSEAEALTRQALESWERNGFYLHTTMHHQDIDTILVSFHEVLAFLAGQERQPAEYAAANARLITQLELLLEAEEPTLKNLF